VSNIFNWLILDFYFYFYFYFYFFSISGFLSCIPASFPGMPHICQAGRVHPSKKETIILLVASEKYFRVYLLLSVSFHFIFLLCVILYTDLFFIFLFLFLYFSFIIVFVSLFPGFHRAFHGCLIFAGRGESTPSRNRASD